MTSNVQEVYGHGSPQHSASCTLLASFLVNECSTNLLLTSFAHLQLGSHGMYVNRFATDPIYPHLPSASPHEHALVAYTLNTAGTLGPPFALTR